MKSPAFQFYPNDFLGGVVATYSLEEIGLYMSLLAFDWNLNGLPTDLEKLAKMSRVSARKFRGLWATVGENFKEHDGRYFNPRLEMERTKQVSNRAKKQAAAASRWNADAHADALQVQCLPSSSPSPTAVKDTVATAPVKKEKAKRPPAPWMGRLNATWKRHMGGNLPIGSATLLQPVVADVGEDATDSRLDAYLDRTAPEFVSLRTFSAKHGTFADKLAVNPVTGTLNAEGMKALGLGGRR